MTELEIKKKKESDKTKEKINQSPLRGKKSEAEILRSIQRAVSDPTRASQEDIIALHKTIGNSAVAKMIQARIKVGASADNFEQEADMVADRVINTPDQDITDMNINKSKNDSMQDNISRLTNLKGITGETPETAADIAGSFEADTGIETAITSSKGSGSPLQDEFRSFAEPRFGADFGGVRVHNDTESSKLNRRLGSEAFTYGRDIYMGDSTYNPATNAGRQLLAHELTHVVQQTGSANQMTKQTSGVSGEKLSVRRRISELTPLKHSAGFKFIGKTAYGHLIDAVVKYNKFSKSNTDLKIVSGQIDILNEIIKHVSTWNDHHEKQTDDEVVEKRTELALLKSEVEDEIAKMEAKKLELQEAANFKEAFANATYKKKYAEDNEYTTGKAGVKWLNNPELYPLFAHHVAVVQYEKVTLDCWLDLKKWGENPTNRAETKRIIEKYQLGESGDKVINFNGVSQGNLIMRNKVTSFNSDASYVLDKSFFETAIKATEYTLNELFTSFKSTDAYKKVTDPNFKA